MAGENRQGAPPLSVTPTALWRAKLEGPGPPITPVQVPECQQGAGATLGLKPGQSRSYQGGRAQRVPSFLSPPSPSHLETGALGTSPLWEILAGPSQ